ncbi:lipocalin-like domain-containing protein [Streptomyces sp. NPDC048516]|uniref:lipocalin-like domain-containing protein n=1 Tax=Streptomyces sp. NPDC048516 TaxID=3365565 RepID=UPI003716A9A4
MDVDVDVDVDEIIGGWSLVHCSVERAGKETRPLGDRPGGMLLYTRGGWMSALLTSDPAIAGRPSAQPAAVTEAGDLQRGVRSEPDELVLTAAAHDGARQHLRWRRGRG